MSTEVTVIVLKTLLPGCLPILKCDNIGEYNPKYGTFIGRFKTLHHDVTGDVYAVDNITIHIRNFHYDGEAPDAFFFAGNKTPKPSHRGFIIPDERGRTDPLGPYSNKNLVLKFPVTKKGQRSFGDIKWLSVWCRKFAIDFGYVQIPSGVQIPNPTSGGYLHSGGDGAAEASNVIMENKDTIVVEDFKFDGSIQDAIFVMGIGEKEPEGYQVPDERGSIQPLGRYNRRTLTLKLPKVTDDDHVQYFGIWSPTRGMISSVKFPGNMKVPPSFSTLR